MTVRTRVQDRTAAIVVHDQGPGIAPRDRRKVFDMFYSTKPGGTGLGLSLCREIIEAHEGRIRVESAVGKGTRFTLRLPLVSTSSSAAA